MKQQTEWIHCPMCGNKTRVRIREDTVLNAVDHDLYIFIDHERIQTVRPEPVSDSRGTFQDVRNARFEHFQYFLRTDRMGRSWSGESSDFLYYRCHYRHDSASGNAFQGGAAINGKEKRTL